MVDRKSQADSKQNDHHLDQPKATTIKAYKQIQLNVPPFLRQNPNSWFRQLEAMFAFYNIVNDRTKFNFIVCILESDILSSVSDILRNPPANDLYETIKQRLLQYFSVPLRIAN